MSTDDSPEREFDVYDSEGLPAAALEHEESISNLSKSEAISNRSNPMENPKPSWKPRREVWWRDLGATNRSLKSIGRCFEDRLNRSLLSSSNSLLRRIRSPKDDSLRRNLHQCPGYLREEITLTCDLSKSVIVSYTIAGPGERCSICHQLVQYAYPVSFDSSNIISESELNLSVSCLYYLSSAFIDDLQVQDSVSGLFADSRNIVINYNTGGAFVAHYFSEDSIMRAAKEIVVKELERNSSVSSSCLHTFVLGLC